MLKVSIITVCFNSAVTIRDTIESVLSQDYKNIEYIIIDGGSVDGTMEIVRTYGDKLSKVISEPDQGIYDAMNKGINLASGEVIGFLNADDVYSHEKVLNRIAETLENTSMHVTQIWFM
jgi:glycosyltransferase involved in cell wall biosynthesis